MSTLIPGATIVYTNGSTTDVERINSVDINGEVFDIVFFRGTFQDNYGTTPPLLPAEATAIQSLVTSIFNGSNPQSPFFPVNPATASSPIASVLGTNEFHAPNFYRGLNPGSGRPDWGSKRGFLGTNAFGRNIWGNSTTGGRELNEEVVFVTTAVPVPEPSPALLLGAAILLGVSHRRKA
ncbi:MAG: PEP-CTERM sorting domain-containing protein [Verrucomicrobiota bacterium]